MMKPWDLKTVLERPEQISHERADNDRQKQTAELTKQKPAADNRQTPKARMKHAPANAPLTTIMTWNYFRGKLEYEGVEYDQKVSEFERFRDLPKRTSFPMKMAVSGDKYDPEAIKRDGWRFVPALPISLTAESYQQFIADSAGESSRWRHRQ